MKKASMLVFRRITSADFFNIYKEPGAETLGGGQSYIDVDTSGVSIADWHNFFSGITPKPKAQGFPLWNFNILSLGTGEQQSLKIGQRRATTVSIREQKISSSRSNRVFAWHPAKGNFPSPKGVLSGSADPQINPIIDGLVIFIIRSTDDLFWAGWMKVQDRPASWTVQSELDRMFNDDDGVLHFPTPLDFDETELNWPFGVSQTSDKVIESAPLPEASTSSTPTLGLAAKKTSKFSEPSEDEAASALFDEDYGDGIPISKKVVMTVRTRNKKAVRALKDLYGQCQISGSKFIFEKVDGKPYLEVHHLIPLGLGGADAPANLVVVSAHIHRMLHHAVVSGLDISKISENKLIFEINGEEHTITWRPDHAATIIGVE